MRITPIAEINLQHLKENFQQIRNMCPESAVMPVVKADAYGHGIIPITTTLLNAGASGFCVALISELESLINLNVNVPILHLGRLYKEILQLTINRNIWCTLNSVDDLQILDTHFRDTGSKTTVHMKIDTGMGRLGVLPEDALDIADRLVNHPGIKLDGLWSHLSTAEENDPSYYNYQINLFNEITARIINKNPGISYRHIANSSAILKYPKSHFNMVRPGIALYGALPYADAKSNLKPVMAFKAPVTLIRKMSKGSSIGYNRKYKLDTDRMIATVQAGYADGVNTALCNIGQVSFGSKLLNIVGKISMDQMAVDVTGVKINPGDLVTIWGGDNRETRVEKVASGIDKIPYELLTSLSNRVEKKIIQEKN
ncbi:MAG: alanine racemase [Candidatus Marinimicrobia bacterium]|jgi:alanine racemase|nr:alanine racemase [Candidatus Neomarinimicrobiota bacterium]MBT3633427.1 alanine racemase [Candidatus Neomarinimicrobiota bacterium]MBT3681570.1 alanine racemase [Candidatus Neomarinimicrobiota bacterium]MBT3758463.1 alanine racemase [Candidatus Neomarinimicrobiota bacterium]MBT3894883.1 alanine racemase [Candidatus Neomarinimicrobiota bacterium]